MAQPEGDSERHGVTSPAAQMPRLAASQRDRRWQRGDFNLRMRICTEPPHPAPAATPHESPRSREKAGGGGGFSQRPPLAPA